MTRSLSSETKFFLVNSNMATMPPGPTCLLITLPSRNLVGHYSLASSGQYLPARTYLLSSSSLTGIMKIYPGRNRIFESELCFTCIILLVSRYVSMFYTTRNLDTHAHVTCAAFTQAAQARLRYGSGLLRSFTHPVYTSSE